MICGVGMTLALVGLFFPVPEYWHDFGMILAWVSFDLLTLASFLCDSCTLLQLFHTRATFRPSPTNNTSPRNILNNPQQRAKHQCELKKEITQISANFHCNFLFRFDSLDPLRNSFAFMKISQSPGSGSR